MPGYEDAFYYLWKERRLPINVDPFENKLSNPEDRERLGKIFEQGLDKIIGYALPLRREHYTDGSQSWVSGAWFYRPERMYLIPGDSAMGFRLPLDSLPWVTTADYPFHIEQDAWEARGPLPIARQLPASAISPARPAPAKPAVWSSRCLAPCSSINAEAFRDLPPAQGESAPWIIRTALVAEPRGGRAACFHAAATLSGRLSGFGGGG